MPNGGAAIEFHHKGIGAILSDNRLAVPLNQREYAWEEEHVQDLFHDLANAIASNERTYFLGTIVLTRGKTIPEVSDGQQRLATTTILLAAIRDYFAETNNGIRAQSIENDYLFTTDLATEEIVPRLRLNVDDNQFFINYVLKAPGASPREAATPLKESHKRIAQAAAIAAKHVQSVVEPYKESARATRLVEWVGFIRDSAEIISLLVPDHLNAFVMFETLNDRGLRASQADLLKNYLLSKAGDRAIEAQQRWAEMTGTLESLGMDDITVNYLRHVLITLHGPTKERQVYAKVRETVNSEQRAIEFVDMLAEAAQDYAALLNPDHKKWNEYGTTTRQHVATILKLRVEQIRPLMFAAARKLSVDELRAAFKLFVSWSVRFLIVGGRGGLLDRAYSLRAYDVGTGKVTSTKGLANAMVDTVPLDPAFEAAFGEARVSHAYLARYYLRALEQKVRDESDNPELVPTEEETVLNLEHVLPANPESNWPNIEPEVAAAHYKRIGNMVLLHAKKNSTVGNAPFSEKREVFKKSPLLLTQEVGKPVNWNVLGIDSRQKRLAKLAVATWPL